MLTSVHPQHGSRAGSARHAYGLTGIKTRIFVPDVGDDQLAAHSDGVATELGGRLPGEKTHLNKNKHTHTYLIEEIIKLVMTAFTFK